MGYKDPPEHTRFQKGQSGNSKGRPVGVANRSTIVKRWLGVKEKALNPVTKKVQNLTQEDIITLALINKARKGDVRAYKELLDSAYGKPPQSMEFFGAMAEVTAPGSADETRAALERVKQAKEAFDQARNYTATAPNDESESTTEGTE